MLLVHAPSEAPGQAEPKSKSKLKPSTSSKPDSAKDSETRHLQISFVYKNSVRSRRLTVAARPGQVICGVKDNFVTLHCPRRHSQQTCQVDVSDIFDQLARDSQFALAEEFVLRLLSDDRNRESGCAG